MLSEKLVSVQALFIRFVVILTTLVLMEQAAIEKLLITSFVTGLIYTFILMLLLLSMVKWTRGRPLGMVSILLLAGLPILIEFGVMEIMIHLLHFHFTTGIVATVVSELFVRIYIVTQKGGVINAKH